MQTLLLTLYCIWFVTYKLSVSQNNIITGLRTEHSRWTNCLLEHFQILRYLQVQFFWNIICFPARVYRKSE